MSARVVIDFGDDGAITLTARPTKSAAVRSVLMAPNSRGEIGCCVHGGSDDTVTHIVRITTADVVLVDSRELCA